MKGNYSNKSNPGIKPGHADTGKHAGSDPGKKTGMTSSMAKSGKMGHGGKAGSADGVSGSVKTTD